MHIILKIIFVFILINSLIPPIGIQGQEQVSLRTKADRLYYQGEYYAASKVYAKLVDKKKPKHLDMERMADSYYQLKEYEVAQNWYARLIQSGNYSDEAQLKYVDVLRKIGNYTEAKKQLLSFKGRVSYTHEIERALQAADSALIWMANPTLHRLVNQEKVNTRYSQFGGFPLSNGIMYSGEPDGWSNGIAGSTGRPFLRAYTASIEADGLTLQYPSIMPELFNDVPYHIGAIIADRKQTSLYVTRTYLGDETQRKRVGNFKFDRRNLELLIYKKEGDRWVEYEFPYNNSKSYSVGHAALSNDEQTLYFASNMPGGYGGTDIWYCEMQADGSWGNPKNAGSVINSTGDELFPYVFDDKLYYSSDGFIGMGGLDIYVASGERGHFSGHRNLHFPVNTAFDDFAFIPIGENNKLQYGYVSSDRTGGLGMDDIYSFSWDKPAGKIQVEGEIINNRDRSRLGNVELVLTDNRGQILTTKMSDAAGSFSFYLEEDMTYRLRGKLSGFFADSLRIETKFSTQDTILAISLGLEPIMEKGNSFILKNIYYDLDQYMLREDAQQVLKQLATILSENPTLRIELSSHTDSRASRKYNLKLSQQRAQAAVDFIVEQGISRDRLVPKGYGESMLLNRCKDGVSCSEAEHQLNRRTEIKVLDY